uniref:HTH cro/C1-type domain-containing protein n=1 Tax=uncultured prokaryote TaxID=198431 RepID=A0A0H5Q342_9ZZZZ|nr:hypothetical protein [uncultured prokaryote]
MEVKEIIRRHRHMNHKTQAELAAGIGVSVSAVKQWETGRCVPSAWAAYRVSVYLDIPVGLLFKERPKIMRTPRKTKNVTTKNFQKPAILVV